MSRSFFDRISVMRVDRDGAMSIVFVDGRVVSASSTREIFEPTSAITSSAYHPHSHQLHLQTKRGHNIVIELPEPAELAPLDDRPTIYLDHNAAKLGGGAENVYFGWPVVEGLGVD